jgi:Skp family chaperone for outer membrane proteins
VKQLLASVAVVGSTLIVSPAVLAQQAAPAPAPGAPAFGANAGRFGMAVVDVSYIFKSYPRFTQLIETLKTEMKTADADLKVIVDRLAAKSSPARRPTSASNKAPCVATSWNAKPRSISRPTRKCRTP